MRRREKWFVVLALAGACSSPDQSEFGFISLGRNAELDGGFADEPPTGGVPTAGAAVTGGDGNGGTSTGGGGPSCGSGGLPTAENAAGATLIEACGRAGPNHRVCLPDDYVAYCGVTPVVLEHCPAGTCASACCFVNADPCPPEGAGVYDCAGDCGGYGSCTEATVTELILVGYDLQVVRIGGSNLTDGGCGRYFTMRVVTRPEAPARVTVSPPWRVSRGCPGPADGQCLLTESNFETVTISTDVEAPPPRNVVVETSSVILRCSP